MNNTLPNPALRNRSAKVGGIFDQISQYLNLGLQGLGAYQQLTAGAGSGSGQAKGLAAITAASQALLQALDQMLGAAQQNPSQAPAITQQAEQLAATLGNSQYFYQAKSGQDAAVLQSAKDKAAQKVAAIRAVTQGGGTVPMGTQTVVTTDPQTGALITQQVPYTQAPQSSSGLAGYAPYIAIAVAALALLKK